MHALLMLWLIISRLSKRSSDFIFLALGRGPGDGGGVGA